MYFFMQIMLLKLQADAPVAASLTAALCRFVREFL